MLRHGAVATSICDCSISFMTASPSSFLQARKNRFDIVWRTFLVRMSETKYSSSIPNR
jgi:hypothetical protein